MSGQVGMVAMMRKVARTPSLRRVEIAFTMFAAAEMGTWLAILVYALEKGGPGAVGVVAVAQLLPGVALSPLAASVGDRFAPNRALAFGYAAQAVSMTVTAALMAEGTTIPAYVAAAVAATSFTFTRPAMAALLPTVTHSPSELVAANVVNSLIEKFGVLTGPLLAGLIIALRSPAAAFAVMAALVAVGCIATLLIRDIERPTVERLDAGDVHRTMLAGFAALRRDRALRVLLMMGVVSGIIGGAADVIAITFSHARLPGGTDAAGPLTAAFGVGAIVGAAALGRVARRGRLSRQLLIGVVLAAIGLGSLVGVEQTVTALAVFVVVGCGETLLDLLSSISIQRAAPSEVTARVFGIVGGARMGAVALGSLAVTAFTRWWSLDVALVALGLVVLVLGVAIVLRLVQVGADLAPIDEAIIERLLADPVLAPLMAPTIERLARGVGMCTFAPGDVVIRQGEIGDRYYLVVDGRLEVTIDGTFVHEHGPGASFGEVALLHDVPRIATVTALTPAYLLTLDRDEFLTAVTGHPRSHHVASATAARYMG